MGWWPAEISGVPQARRMMRGASGTASPDCQFEQGRTRIKNDIFEKRAHERIRGVFWPALTTRRAPNRRPSVGC